MTHRITNYSTPRKSGEHLPEETAILEDAPPPSEEHATTTPRRLTPATAIANMRAHHRASPDTPTIKDALDKFERAVPSGAKDGDEPSADSDDQPTTSRTGPPSGVREADHEPPAPLSRFALRDDGVVLLSIDDMHDRVLEGRELQTFLVLRPDERARARDIVDDGICAAASSIAASIPKKRDST